MEIVKRIRNKIGIEIKAGFWYTIGNFFLKGAIFLTIPILTRLLSPSDYGLISLFTTWVGVFTVIAGLSLHSSIVRGYNDFKEDFESFLSSILFLSIICFLCLGILVTIFSQNLTSLIGFTYPIIILILLHSFFSFVIEFNNIKYIPRYQYKKSLLISISNVIIGIVLSILLVLSFTNNLYMGYIYGVFIPCCIIGSILFFRILYKGKKFISKKYWKYALILSLPMIPHLLAHLIIAQADRIMINMFIGASAVGIYSFAYNIGLISSVILGSLNNAWVPWFYNKMDENDETTILKKSEVYILFFIFLIVGLIYISPELVIIMAPSDYMEAVWIVPIIIMSFFFQFLYVLLVNVQFYYKKNLFIPIGTVIAGLINIGLNFYYLPIYGYVAAAYTTLVSYAILFLMHYLVTRYLIKSDLYKLGFFVKPLLITSLFSILFFIVSDLLFVRYAIIIITISYLLIKYKSKLLQFVN